MEFGKRSNDKVWGDTSYLTLRLALQEAMDINNQVSNIIDTLHLIYPFLTNIVFDVGSKMGALPDMVSDIMESVPFRMDQLSWPAEMMTSERRPRD